MKRRPGEQRSMLPLMGLPDDSEVRRLVPQGKLLLLAYLYDSTGNIVYMTTQEVDDEEMAAEATEAWLGRTLAPT